MFLQHRNIQNYFLEKKLAKTRIYIEYMFVLMNIVLV
jgi:hypothetical protein